MEADRPVQNIQKTISPGQTDKPQDLLAVNKEIKDRVKKIVDRAVKSIDEDIAKLEARNKVLQTQAKAFETEYNGLRANYQPARNLQIINYKYDDNVLEKYETAAKSLFMDAYNKFSGFVGNPSRIDSRNNMLGADYRRVVASILDKFNTPPEIRTTEGIYSLTKQQFRSEKETITIGSGALAQYVAQSKNMGNIVSNARDALNDVKAKVNNLTNILDNFINNNSNTAEYKKRLPKMVRNFISLANFYIGMIMYCFELRVERVINARIIVKNFYKKKTVKSVERQKRIEGENES